MSGGNTYSFSLFNLFFLYKKLNEKEILRDVMVAV